MQRKITFWVVAIHAALVMCLLFSPARKIHHPTKHIAVRMTQMRPVERSVSPPSKSPGSSQTSAPKPAAAKPVQKKIAKKTQAASTPTPKPVAKSPKPAVVDKGKPKVVKPAIPKELIEELEETVAKIDEKSKKVYSSPKLDVPRLMTPPQMESFFAGEPSYEESLVAYLHQSLNLPEYGEVKIQLALYKDGTVAKLTVLKAESLKNKTYLEKNLPLLKFPSLEKEETFVFTFCNEI